MEIAEDWDLQLARLPPAATGEANKTIGLRFLMLAQAEKTCQGKTSAGNGLYEIAPFLLDGPRRGY
jgi:hypothetical protein